MYRRLRTGSPAQEASTQSLSPTETHFANQNKLILSPIPDENMQIDPNTMQKFTKSRQSDVIDQTAFDRHYKFNRMYLSHSARISLYFKNKKKMRGAEWCHFLFGLMPITKWLPEYAWKTNFIRDLFGGLMVSVMSVPQSLAYGMLVGVPPNYGLITGIIGPLIYAFFGTSRHASPGSFAIVSLMVGAVVETFGNLEKDGLPPPLPFEEVCCRESKPQVADGEAIAIATSVTLLVGLFQILFGIMNAGLLAVWLSEQLVQGLISGAAVHVLTSQLKSMTGITNVPSTSEAFEHIKFYICFFRQIGRAEIPAIIMSLICVAFLLISSYVIDPWLSKRIPLKFPMELVLVVGGTLIVRFTRKTSWEFPIRTVGVVKAGFPKPLVPPLNNAVQMIGPAITIAIISFVMHISLCKIVAKKHQYMISSNQEWLALGMMHTTASFFGCFAGGSSLGRTMMQVKIGTKTQLSTIICSGVLLIFVLGAPGLIEHLPKPVLASIVVVAMKDLFIQIYTCSKLRNKNFVDYLIWAATFTSVVVINVNYGLIIGVVFELLTVVLRSQWADSTLLGRIKGTNHFRRLGLYATAYDIPGIKVFRFDSPLYFANSELFLGRINKACGINPVLWKGEEQKKGKEPEKQTDGTTRLEVTAKSAKVMDKEEEKDAEQQEEMEKIQLTHLIVDCSAILYVDLMGLDVLIDVYNEYKLLEIAVFFANAQERVRQLFETTDFFKEIPRNHVFVSVADAVDQAELEQGRKKALSADSLATRKPIQAPVAKSVGQKSAPINDNTVLPSTQRSEVSVRTGVEFSQRDTTAKEGGPVQRRMRNSRSSIHWDDLDKTQ